MKRLLLHKGFTLIELLVVIAIISILTAIVTSNFTSSKAKARDAARVSDVAQIQLALSLYFDKCNSYPGSLINTSSGAGCSVPFGQYISVIPKDPLSNSDYYYKTNATASNSMKATNYIIATKLELNNTNVLNDSLKTINPSDIQPGGGSGGTNYPGVTISGSTLTCSGLTYCVAPY